ncbi:MAG: dihydropteroate synthase [Ilyomonas sp.]
MFTLNCKGRLLTIDKPMVMGIMNVTPDSFYPGSRKFSVDEALQTVEKMLTEGATILDIGGQSTRPHSEQITETEEADRVLPVIETIIETFPSAFISIDTFYASVAQQAVYAGASIVNDISGGLLDDNMLQTVGVLKVPFVCMHMKGTPATMQQLAQYENVTREVLDYFINRTEACRKAGISDVIIDPGFGFAKTVSHNFELLKNLDVFRMLDKPLLAGISRKATIYKTLHIPVEEAVNGTTVLNTIALLNGANILRVHDVKQAMEAIELIEAYKSS